MSWEKAARIASVFAPNDCASSLKNSLPFLCTVSDSVDLGADYSLFVTTMEVYLAFNFGKVSKDGGPLKNYIGRACGPRFFRNKHHC